MVLATPVLGALMTPIRYYSFQDIPWYPKQPAFSDRYPYLAGGMIGFNSEYVRVMLAVRLRCN